MHIDQKVIDDTVVGVVDYISYLSDKYLNMLLFKDVQLSKTENRLMYIINLKNSLENYDYTTEFFTDEELIYLIGQITLTTDELPNNSIYGRF